MNDNYIPYLKYNEFGEEYTFNHYHTGNDFFTIDKNSNKYYPDHLSELNQIIPEDINLFDNRNIYKNNIFLETKELTPQNNFVYSSKNIHLEDMDYKKYLLNIKDENTHRKRSINKKNNSQNKITKNLETFDIIQIYEAPPLELTPISENEKNESIEIKKKPKYYRKKKIYSLEDNNIEIKSKNKLFDLDFNELEKISKKFESKEHENNPFLRAIKSSNSKNKKKVLESKDSTEIKDSKKEKLEKEKIEKEKIEKEKIEKNYVKYFSKESIVKPQLKKSDNIINNKNIKINNNMNININSSINGNNKILKNKKDANYKKKIYNKYKLNVKIEEKENENEKENIHKNNIKNLNEEAKEIKERIMYKRKDNKSFIHNMNNKFAQNFDVEQNKMRLTIEKKDLIEKDKIHLNQEQEKKDKEKEKEDKRRNDKEKRTPINIKENKEFKNLYKSTNYNNFKREEKAKKEKINFENKERIVVFNKIENINEEKNKNLMFDKNKNQKKGEIKVNLNDKKENEVKKEENKEKEIRTANHVSNKNNLNQIRIIENNKVMFSSEKSRLKVKEPKKEKNNIILNIEIDKAQMSNNKRTYLYSKIERCSDQDINKNNKVINIPKNKENYSKRYIYSFSVEKNKEELKENGKKNNTERKTTEITSNTKLTEDNKKNQNDIDTKTNKNDSSSQIKNTYNQNNISSKNEGENKNENKSINEDNNNKKENPNAECIIRNRKRNGISTPNPQENHKKEESMPSFGNTVRSSMYNANNYYNKNTADKKNNNNNIIIENKKDNNIYSSKNNTNAYKEVKKENNLKTIINSTQKSMCRTNHNYLAINSNEAKKVNNIIKINTSKEKIDKNNDNKRLNNQENNLINEGDPFSASSSNKNEQKQNYRDNNRRLTNDLNNCNINNKNNANSSGTANNINNYHALRGTSVKSVDIKIQNNNDVLNKRKVAAAPINNHSVKISYGINTFKIPNDKKEKEIKISTKINEENCILNYANNKNGLNSSILSNNAVNTNTNNTNNNTNNNNNENKGSFVNINNNNRREIISKNNHTLYVSIISSKK